jgi:apolipoprotein D and lipocalin family protein
MKIIIALFVLFTINSQAFDKLPTAAHVDVAQYVGKWYAVTALPQRFTKKCVAQTAEYALKTANSVSVLNTCIKANGATKTIEGQAVVANAKTNAELIVTFNNFWTKLFRVKGDYTIIRLADDYSSVLVGSNDRKSLWILARDPYLNDVVKTDYITLAATLGFDTAKLIESKF